MKYMNNVHIFMNNVDSNKKNYTYKA